MPTEITHDFDPNLSMLAYKAHLMERFDLRTENDWKMWFGTYSIREDFDGAPWVVIWDEGPDDFAYTAAPWFSDIFRNLNLPFHAEPMRMQVLAFYRD